MKETVLTREIRTAIEQALDACEKKDSGGAAKILKKKSIAWNSSIFIRMAMRIIMTLTP